MGPLIEQIKRTLNLLFQPGDTIELRCVGDRTINGFYRDTHKLAQDAHDLNSNFSPLQNTYVCLNPVRSDLYARRPDQFSYAQKGESVKDCDISCRRWLLIDIDPIRPTGVSATSEQKQAAIEVAKTVYGWLQEQRGATCIVCADSGNGGHMLIRLPDVFANDETRWVCEHFLQMLSDQFSTDQAKVDLTTFNSSRICTIYGTIKRKGADIPEQPHRLSKLLHVPDPLQPVDWHQLASLIDPYPGEQQAAPQPAGPTWNVDALLQEHELQYSRDDHYRTNSGELATRFELEICPFNARHNDRSAVILQWQNGAVCFKCHHDGCSGKGWKELKQLWDLPDGNGITTADIILPSPPAQQQSELVIVRSQDVETESISWLEQDRFVIGGINLCAGRGGIGKTYFLCDLVARITNSALSAPNGQPLQHGRVLYSTSEDHIAKVIETRMQQHNADRTRLEYIKGLPDGPYVRLLDVIEHCDLLRDALRQLTTAATTDGWYADSLQQMEQALYGPPEVQFPVQVDLGGKQYHFAVWQGEQLPDRLLAYDTETAAIESNEIPELALATVYGDAGSCFFIHPADLPRFVLQHHQAYWCCHNATFDFWVTAQHLQGDLQACGVWWDVAGDSRLICTMLLEQPNQVSADRC